MIIDIEKDKIIATPNLNWGKKKNHNSKEKKEKNNNISKFFSLI